MNVTYKRQYCGPVEAVICDWAGTTYDFGSLAPMRAFQALFEANGVPITLPEAREPMGTEKREHITRILAMPRVKAAWQAAHGQEADDEVIDSLYHAFVPLQIEAIKHCAQAIPGWMDTLAYLQQRDILVGANTGYNREMLSALSDIASQQGYTPDSSVCATDVPKGRPYPHMSLKNALELGVSDVRACIKVDDTLPGIDEGLAAGMWTVGVAVSGNETGLSLEAWHNLAAAEQNQFRQNACQRFRQVGTHIIIDSVADLPRAVEQIEAWIQQGFGPDTLAATGLDLTDGSGS